MSSRRNTRAASARRARLYRDEDVALMAKAGHTDMKVTRQYLHLAGIVFHDEAEALERRLGLGIESGPVLGNVT